MKIKNIFLLILAVLTTILLSNKNGVSENLKWFGKKTEYQGFPLLLRKPDHKNIYEFKTKYSKLLTITHILDKVQNNGLPEADYNLTLQDLDHDIVTLFNERNEGIIILIETFGGKRHYYFYIDENFNYNKIIEKIKKKYNNYKFEITEKLDNDWGFIKKYPEKIY